MENIQELLATEGIEFMGEDHRHVRSGWIGIDCPYCADGSGKFHMGIFKGTGAVSCWRCGSHSLRQVLTDILRVTGHRAGVLIRRTTFEDVPEATVTREGLSMPKGLRDLPHQHRQYLAKRGLDPYEIERLWGLRATVQHASLPWRLFIPIIENDQTVSWTTRTIGKAQPRYISASPSQESVDHKSILYGEHYCTHSIIVHEGPADVWATGPGATAIFGSYPTIAQIKKIAKYPIRILCFDSDTKAQQRAKRLADQLQAFPGETILSHLETGEDAADAKEHELNELRKLIK